MLRELLSVAEPVTYFRTEDNEEICVTRFYAIHIFFHSFSRSSEGEAPTATANCSRMKIKSIFVLALVFIFFVFIHVDDSDNLQRVSPPTFQLSCLVSVLFFFVCFKLIFFAMSRRRLSRFQCYVIWSIRFSLECKKVCAWEIFYGLQKYIIRQHTMDRLGESHEQFQSFFPTSLFPHYYYFCAADAAAMENLSLLCFTSV